MYWTFELIKYLVGAPWPATKKELIEYVMRIGAPPEVAENLAELEEETYHSIDEIWPDKPSEDEYYFNEDEY